MGKQGPCCHCGVTSTPLWRNGPPEKPVLCNACGSRWRTKGSLVNYFPIQARVFTPPDYEGSRYSRKDKLPPLTKYKNSYIKVHNESKVEDGPSYAAYPSSFEDDASNKSSSGSAISISESCVQFGSTDGNEISGPFESSFYDVQIPSKKRTRVRRCSPPPIENLRQDLRCHSPSPVEKLRQDLVSILQQQDSSYNSEFSEELLLFERDDLSFQSEIGHGSVLLKPQVSSKEEESEASSHRTENKASCIRKTYMGSSYWSLQSQNNQICSLQSVKDDMIQDTGDTNELKENLVKQCFSTNKSLEGAFSGNPDVLRSKYPCQASISESSNSVKEISSFTSDVTGSGNSICAKRPRDSPYILACKGKGSGTGSTFKRPREPTHVETLTSRGDESVHTSSGTQNFSEFHNTWTPM